MRYAIVIMLMVSLSGCATTGEIDDRPFSEKVSDFVIEHGPDLVGAAVTGAAAGLTYGLVAPDVDVDFD